MGIDLLYNDLGHDIPPETQELFSSAEILIPRDEILRAVDQLAIRLTVAFRHERPLILFHLKDAGWFFGCLIQRLRIPLNFGCFEIEQGSRENEFVWKIEPTASVKNNRVMFLFGDFDDKNEEEFVSNWCLERGAASMLSAALVIRAGEGLSCNNHYSCFPVGEESIVGCGLSRDGYGSNLPDLYSLAIS